MGSHVTLSDEELKQAHHMYSVDGDRLDVIGPALGVNKTHIAKLAKNHRWLRSKTYNKTVSDTRTETIQQKKAAEIKSKRKYAESLTVAGKKQSKQQAQEKAISDAQAIRECGPPLERTIVRIDPYTTKLAKLEFKASTDLFSNLPQHITGRFDEPGMMATPQELRTEETQAYIALAQFNYQVLQRAV